MKINDNNIADENLIENFQNLLNEFVLDEKAHENVRDREFLETLEHKSSNDLIGEGEAILAKLKKIKMETVLKRKSPNAETLAEWLWKLPLLIQCAKEEKHARNCQKEVLKWEEVLKNFSEKSESIQNKKDALKTENIITQLKNEKFSKPNIGLTEDEKFRSPDYNQNEPIKGSALNIAEIIEEDYQRRLQGYRNQIDLNKKAFSQEPEPQFNKASAKKTQLKNHDFLQPIVDEITKHIEQLKNDRDRYEKSLFLKECNKDNIYMAFELGIKKLQKTLEFIKNTQKEEAFLYDVNDDDESITTNILKQKEGLENLENTLESVFAYLKNIQIKVRDETQKLIKHIANNLDSEFRKFHEFFKLDILKNYQPQKDISYDVANNLREEIQQDNKNSCESRLKKLETYMESRGQLSEKDLENFDNALNVALKSAEQQSWKLRGLSTRNMLSVSDDAQTIQLDQKWDNTIFMIVEDYMKSREKIFHNLQPIPPFQCKAGEFSTCSLVGKTISSESKKRRDNLKYPDEFYPPIPSISRHSMTLSTKENLATKVLEAFEFYRKYTDSSSKEKKTFKDLEHFDKQLNAALKLAEEQSWKLRGLSNKTSSPREGHIQDSKGKQPWDDKGWDDMILEILEDAIQLRQEIFQSLPIVPDFKCTAGELSTRSLVGKFIRDCSESSILLDNMCKQNFKERLERAEYKKNEEDLSCYKTSKDLENFDNELNAVLQFAEEKRSELIHSIVQGKKRHTHGPDFWDYLVSKELRGALEKRKKIVNSLNLKFNNPLYTFTPHFGHSWIRVTPLKSLKDSQLYSAKPSLSRSFRALHYLLKSLKTVFQQAYFFSKRKDVLLSTSKTKENQNEKIDANIEIPTKINASKILKSNVRGLMNNAKDSEEFGKKRKKGFGVDERIKK